jgi:hypothetical protein
MITFTQLGQYGRLGNQLFQYAILVAIGNERGYEIRIPDYNNKYHHGQNCLLGNFNISAQFYLFNYFPTYTYSENQSDSCRYIPAVFNVADNTDMFGFFQNYQYYKKYENIIIKELTPNKKIIDINTEILNKIKSKYLGYEIVSLHLRRGDVGSASEMYGKLSDLDLNSVWYKYFSEAKKYFANNKIKFLIFTGGNRDTSNDSDNYEWCKRNLVGDEYIYYDYDKTVINDFTLMYLCDHHILAMGSSLSWWVGFLNKKKENKIIVAPKKYHVIKDIDEGFYPDNFIVV